MGFFKKLRILLIGGREEDFFFLQKLMADSHGEQPNLDWVDFYESEFSAAQDRYDVYLIDCTFEEQALLDFLSRSEGRERLAPVILLGPSGANPAWSQTLLPGAVDSLKKEELNGATLRRVIRYAVEREKTRLELAAYRQQVTDLTKIISIPAEETTRLDIEDKNTFLRTMLESLSHPFYIVDAKDHRVLLANRAAMPPDLQGEVKCHTVFHGSDTPCSGSGHLCPLEQIRKTGKPVITEHMHFDAEGKAGNVEVHGYPIVNQKGEVCRIIAYCLDASDRKRIEQRLRKNQEELETRVRERTEELADANLALMVEIAERKQAEEALRLNEKRLQALLNLGQIPWSSEEQIVGYVLEQELKLTRSETGAIGFLDEDQKIVKWCSVISSPGRAGSPHYFDTPTEEAGAWGEAIKKCRPVVANEVVDTDEAAKGLPFSPMVVRRFLSIPICQGERTIAVGVVANKRGCYDQSDLIQLTLLMDGMWKLIERERSIKALKDAENLAGIGRALSSVAHDMKTPLIAIGGFAKQVQRRLNPSDPSRAKTEIILKETERLQKMVEDMLDFSKPLELRKSFEQIGPILEESVAVIKPLADAKRIELRVEAVGPIPGIPLDPMRIKRVFTNLLTNAIEASPEGQPVRIVYRRSDKYLVIDVSDKGPGIPCEIRKDIFSPFFTTRKGGTGLGLPIVKKVIEAHKGGIEVLNSPCGTTFRLRLPTL
jgi:signal transduction histidine kinase/PAS domain-containing protein